MARLHNFLRLSLSVSLPTNDRYVWCRSKERHWPNDKAYTHPRDSFVGEQVLKQAQVFRCRDEPVQFVGLSCFEQVKDFHFDLLAFLYF